ncbi:helix-turn-helix transcriptional regulator [Mariprofundus ferrooxydans]|nr:helix-turn-helix transcriptional regulator [Mariprofundus ferrooxydans]
MQEIPKDKIIDASQGLRAIAHELRLSVLCLLLEGPLCVHEIMQATGAAQSNLSQHLAKMRLLGIIQNEKRGQQVFYRIANPAWADLVMALKQIYCPEMCTPAESKE